MVTSETLDKLIPALVEARKAMLPAGKGGMNDYDNYGYAREEDWHAATMPALLENGLVLLFSTVVVSDAIERPTKKGGVEYNRTVHGVARLLHSSGEWIQVGCSGEGQDRGDKAIYKAITGMKKYGYATILALPTSDDPEKHRDKDEHDAAPTPKPPASPPKGNGPTAQPSPAAGAKAPPPVEEAIEAVGSLDNLPRLQVAHQRAGVYQGNDRIRLLDAISAQYLALCSVRKVEAQSQQELGELVDDMETCKALCRDNAAKERLLSEIKAKRVELTATSQA